MKKNILSISLLFIVVVAFLFTSSRLITVQDDDFKKAEEHYKKYCAGCHFNLDAFLEQDWEHGKTVEGAYTSIKYGLLDIGMPSFRKTFNDEEMLALSRYMVSKGNQKSFSEQLDWSGVISSKKLDYKLEVVVDDLEIPWGMCWLPNGDMLITERMGRLTRNTPEGQKIEINGIPKVYQFGQGGLLDIELHPEYEENGWIYITYSYYAGETLEDGGSTALMRCKLKNNELVDQEILWKATPAKKKGPHYGSRIEFDREGYLYLTIGDRGESENAQDISNYSGAVHRLNDDGSIPKDNPFAKKKDAVASIYNFGHRNIQGLALNPETGELWSHEHGPRGGDELNIEKAGLNYGWPEISYGINYNGSIITEDSVRTGMEQPIIHWTPSIAPCGMDFVEGDKYPGWEGDILVGSLRFKYVLRCRLDDNKVVDQEILMDGMGRVRNVKMGPDGYIYVGIENPGRIIKIVAQ